MQPTIKQSEIVSLYQNELLSMAQIGLRLGVSESAVRYHLDHAGVARRSISEAVTNLYITKFGKQPCKFRSTLDNRQQGLKIAGTMLYWGEGNKTGAMVQFANSDPAMVKLFMMFLREICGVDEGRLRVLLHLYEGQDQPVLEQFWSELTQIPLEQFSATYIHPGKIGTYKRKSQHGTISVRYSDKKLLTTLLKWITEYQTLLPE